MILIPHLSHSFARVLIFSGRFVVASLFEEREKCEKSTKDDLQVNLMSQKGTKHDQRRHNRLAPPDDDDDGERARHKAQRSQFSVSFFGAQDKAMKKRNRASFSLCPLFATKQLMVAEHN